MHDCTFRKLARHTHVFTSRGLITKGLENEKGKKAFRDKAGDFLGFSEKAGFVRVLGHVVVEVLGGD